eukprot:scaffold947_cov375-Prasinococcus_capsulatus_cf.AAC.7
MASRELRGLERDLQRNESGEDGEEDGAEDVPDRVSVDAMTSRIVQLLVPPVLLLTSHGGMVGIFTGSLRKDATCFDYTSHR